MRTLTAIFMGLAGVMGAFTSHAASAQGFELSSPDIAPGSTIKQAFAFNDFGCTGQNTSPAAAWRNPPAGTRSFAVMVHDPDAPTGGAGFWHWVVVDIPATAALLPRGVGTPDGRKLPMAASCRVAPARLQAISARRAGAALARRSATSRTAMCLPSTR